jgi:ATP-dependent exoDNAse (exonuclease V) beta subunit
MLVALSKEDPSEELKKARDLAEQQEMQRLLYVATTRARHTLVLALDRELFLDSKGKLSRRAHLKLLLGEPPDANAEKFEALATAPQACGLTSGPALGLPKQTEALSSSLEIVDQKVVQKATRHANDFMRKVNPSGLSPEEIAIRETWQTRERTPAAAGPAARYGVWWHEFIEKIPWEADPPAWDEVFEINRATSSDPARSAREWKLLRDRVSKLADFDSNFNGGTVVRTEMPFFWRMDEARCLEGIIDLALFDPATKKWFVLDWKTNRVAADKIDTLRAQYLPQLAAYCKVISEMTGGEVNAAIFSTANGEFVRYEPGELEQEWTRLQNLPAKELLLELSDDAL